MGGRKRGPSYFFFNSKKTPGENFGPSRSYYFAYNETYKGDIMDAYSRRFAIKITEENRETIQFLYWANQYDLRPDMPKIDDDKIGQYFKFTVSRSRFIANRKIVPLGYLHSDDNPRLKDNTITLLEVSKI
jgi:hypothetical protein